MGLAYDLHAFPSRAELAKTLAATIAAKLSDAIARRGVGFIAVSGGSTPALLFAELSSAAIDWKKVIVTLIDERLVPPDQPRSNARLVADRLLQGPAAAATFAPLYHGTDDGDEAAARARAELAGLPWPLDVAVLGMGPDGHTASFFPDAPDVAQLLAADAAKLVLPVESVTAQEHRLTLTLGKIVEAGFLALHIEGPDKRQVLDRALGGEKLPIRAAIEASPRPVEIFWAE
ncbi:6-phosphogluconolactonase [Mesorhizobium sp. YM1C-6-2]|jgi:6-phosphogluconolactonase|uniref:6-phosphogluconolactonase n=1 Tax=Mesorhizobium sp. YM1C-6-2 TaxID=1827501 RepID=UPI000EF28360|nr:6-phosphogluconolactonase [Mesorhizobium sp. YM1C-6-2]RLP22952.1 6-phosphogluconolactonase [Mesorhizobium sp. YM1C-6-2]